MEPEEQEKPATYTECTAEKEIAEKNSRFNETDTTTVIRRCHVRVDLQAGGLGQRPPSVVSSDQEYPPLEHKDIPIPSPYAKRLQQNQEVSIQNNEVKSQLKGHVEENALIKSCHNKISQDNNQDHGQTDSVITQVNQNVAVDNKTKSNITNERHAFTETVCQKTVANAKNDQIKISAREKLAKNKEEVSGKRSSFTEAESKVDQTDKANLNANQCSTISNTHSAENLIDKLINREVEANDTEQSANVSKFVSKVGSQKEYVANAVPPPKPNSQTINNIINRSIEESEPPQTTWEQEKQKAELAKLRLQENVPANTNQQINVSQNVSPAIIPQQHVEKKQSNEHVSESSIHDDSDSSDTKTITNLEYASVMDMQNVNEENDSKTAIETPKTNINQTVPITPDTMTADEAENLLSSR